MYLLVMFFEDGRSVPLRTFSTIDAAKVYLFDNPIKTNVLPTGRVVHAARVFGFYYDWTSHNHKGVQGWVPPAVGVRLYKLDDDSWVEDAVLSTLG